MAAEKIMIADDDRNILFAFEKTFEQSGHPIVAVSSGEAVFPAIARERPAVLFLDVAMPQMNGLDILEKLKEQGSDLPVIVITAYGTMQTAIRTMKLGAYDYLTKPLDVEKVRTLARRAIDMVRLRDEVKDLRRQLTQPARADELIGNTPAMQEIYKRIGAVTTTPNTTNVIIFGESGTGKELVARAIHQSGPHAAAPFVAINCTVLPETLLESELFGHEKGAFTGADSRKLGKFEIAGEGTLLLDEIGDMPAKLQQKLLRVVQERCFERVGGHESIPLRARIITATNRNLEEEVQRGNFREDLYFRLNVIEIRMPSLRERRDDIPLLVEHFLVKYSQQFHKYINRVCPEVMQAFIRHDFPGNVRELENLIERAVALEKGDVLASEAFPPHLFAARDQQALDIPIMHENLAEARQVVLEAFERKFIIERLQASHGNVTEAARVSGIERQSFQRLMKKYEVHSDDFREKAARKSF